MKHITLLLSFIFLLLACRPSATLVQARKDCIARVIALDDSLGKARNHACEIITLSETIRQYADGMEKINYQGCPKAFRSAFQKHRMAWLALLPVTDQYPALRGEMHVLFKQLESGEHADRFKPLVKAVWDTWAEVEAAMKAQ